MGDRFNLNGSSVINAGCLAPGIFELGSVNVTPANVAVFLLLSMIGACFNENTLTIGGSVSRIEDSEL